MIGKHFGPLSIGLVALLVAPSFAAAQDEAGYRHFKINDDYAQLLSKRFENNKQLEPLKDLVKQLLANPDKLPFDPEKFKDMKLEDENLKKLVQEWVSNDPAVKKSLQEWLKQNSVAGQPPDLKKLQSELKIIVDEAVKKEDGAAEQAAPPQFPGPIEAAEPEGDPFAKMAERALKQTEHSRLGEWLRHSPAWKRAFDDLHGTAADPNAPRWKLEGWQAKLLAQDGAVWKIGEKTMGQLRNLPKPEFQGLDWASSAVSKIPTPDLGGPSLPSLTMGKTLTWVLAALLFLLVGWTLLRWRKRAPATTVARPDLGPWPVRPEAVATRADLIRAFDYLALWTLGLTAKSWNHHAVARSWQERSSACAAPAMALARLYEQARYTDGVEALTEAECAAARGALVQIAEAL